MDVSFDTTEVRLFTQRISERLRQLRLQPELLPNPARALARSVVEELEEGVEELRVTGEELHVQNEELHEATRALEAERDRVRTLFDLAPAAILSTDSLGTISELNRAAARLLGLPRDLLLGKPLAAFVTDRREFRAQLAKAAGSEVPQDSALALRPRGGEPIAVVARAVAAPGTEGSELAVIWSLLPPEPGTAQPASDAHAPAAAAARLRQAERAVQTSARAIADLSHEFRTPLHSILGYTELLLEGVPEPIPDASARQVRSIAQVARHLARLVEDVLSLHRLHGGQQTVQAADVAVADVLRDCAMILRGSAEAKGLALDLEAQPDLTMRTDPSKLRQILINLLGNGIKFTSEGGVRAWADARDGRIVFTVRDTGPGIPAADLPHVFEPFWRGHPTAGAGADGAGLGLALVRSLVDRLGGSLELETAPGSGTTFRVSLPAAIEG